MNNEVAVLIQTRINESNEVVVSGRELHEFLEVKSNYTTWFERMCEYDFQENEDYVLLSNFGKQTGSGGHNKQDHAIKLDMAKEIAMIQRSDKGKQARKYFLDIERKWNSPEMVMKRALEFANQQVALMEKRMEEQKPKVLLAESIGNSDNLILVRELATILKQAGHDTGEKRLYKWLRENGYLIKARGTDYNMPTQRSKDLGVLKLVERTRTTEKGIKLDKTAKVTGKGQQYFVVKFNKGV